MILNHRTANKIRLNRSGGVKSKPYLFEFNLNCSCRSEPTLSEFELLKTTRSGPKRPQLAWSSPNTREVWEMGTERWLGLRDRLCLQTLMKSATSIRCSFFCFFTFPSNFETTSHKLGARLTRLQQCLNRVFLTTFV